MEADAVCLFLFTLRSYLIFLFIQTSDRMYINMYVISALISFQASYGK